MSWTKTPTKAETTKKQKFVVPSFINKWGKLEYKLTPELEKEFSRLYPVTPNREIMGLFGISFSTMQRFKKELGLEKDMAVIKRKHTAQIKRICEKNGYYDSIRGKKPTVQCLDAIRKWWKDGNNPYKSLKDKNPRKYRKVCKANGEHRKKQFQDERRRVAMGLEQKTKLNIPQFEYTISQRNHRYNALKRGYILGDVREMMGERYTIFFDKKTERSDRFERNLTKDGFTIAAL